MEWIGTDRNGWTTAAQSRYGCMITAPEGFSLFQTNIIHGQDTDATCEDYSRDESVTASYVPAVMQDVTPLTPQQKGCKSDGEAGTMLLLSRQRKDSFMKYFTLVMRLMLKLFDRKNSHCLLTPYLI